MDTYIVSCRIFCATLETPLDLLNSTAKRLSLEITSNP